MGVKVREKTKGSGEWWVFINHSGRRRARKVGTKKDADKVKSRIDAQLLQGVPIEFDRPEEKPPLPTVREYFETFTRVYLETAVREATRDSYARNYRVHILPAIGDLRLDEVSRSRLKDLVAELVGRDALISVKKKKGKATEATPVAEPAKPLRKLSRATIRIITAELSALFNHAREDGLITDNPASRLGRFFKQSDDLHPEIQPLDKNEVPLFLRAVREHAAEHYPLFLCAIHTGMRSGELAGLQWGDVDFNGKFLMVRRHAKGNRVTGTKTDKIRRVDMSDALQTALLELRKERKAEAMRAGKNTIPDWVFVNEVGGPPDMQNTKNRHFFRCLEKAKLRRIRFHDLRHTFATLLIAAGEPLAYIKDQLGHSSIRMTVDVYGHLVPGANRQAVNRLPSADSPVKGSCQEDTQKAG